MLETRSLRCIALRFTVSLVLLTLFPGQSCRDWMGNGFRKEIHWLLKTTLPDRFFLVEKQRDPAHPSIDTRITVARREDIRPDGTARAKVIEIDSRSLGWMPHAMMLALIAALPASLRYRWTLVLPAMGIIHLFVLATLLITVAHSLVGESSSFWAGLLPFAYRLFVSNLWVSFLFPCLLWIGLIGLTMRSNHSQKA